LIAGQAKTAPAQVNGNENSISISAHNRKVPGSDDEARSDDDPLTLRLGISSSEFRESTERAGTICGKANVEIISKASQLGCEPYQDRQKAHDMHNMVDREYFAASAMASPAKVSDVQGIMRLCNEFEVPV
jgi:hypothetical protein